MTPVISHHACLPASPAPMRSMCEAIDRFDHTPFPSMSSSSPWPAGHGKLSRPRARKKVCERASHRDLQDQDLLINDVIAPKGASSNEPQGADQPAEEVKAASGVRVAGGTVIRSRVGSIRCGCLSDGLSDWSIAQLEQLAAQIEASSEEEPAASVPLRSRKHARSESDVGSEGSVSIASKVGRLTLTVRTFPPSRPAAAPQAATADAAPKAAPQAAT